MQVTNPVYISKGLEIEHDYIMSFGEASNNSLLAAGHTRNFSQMVNAIIIIIQ